jgi:hypothetical protein
LRRAEHIVASLLKKAVMAKLLNYHWVIYLVVDILIYFLKIN